MSTPVIEVNELSKHYQLGSIGHPSLRRSLEVYWRKLLQKQAPDEYEDAAQGRWQAEGPRTKPAQAKSLWALKDISFSIHAGETLGIIGRNGAGKSTLLKILSRITEPTCGHARIQGRVASLLEVGTGFHPELTGRENIFLNGAILGMKRSEIKRKFDEIVHFSEVEAFIDTPVKRYSSGMTVRLAFAVAAHLDSDILIVDEVLAVGDSTYQKKCIDKMKQTVREGRTVLFVSHQLATLSNLCTRSILLDHGHLVQDGPTQDVIGHYLNSDKLSGGQRTWAEKNAPGTSAARLRGIRVLSKGRPTDQAKIDTPIDIELSFDCLEEGAELSCCIHLFDKLGNVVFASMNLPSVSAAKDPIAEKPYAKGSYEARCTIPANFLNDEYYSVHIFFVQDVTQILAHIEDAVSFTVIDTGAMRQEYSGAWPGAIRPKLVWTTERIH